MTVEATTDAIPTPLSAPAAEVTTTQVVTVQNAPAPGETEQPARPSLSPSRAADFKTCPLLYRFRSVDRLPERPSFDQLRGTLVHAVLERLFDLPAEDRTPERAADLVEPQWTRMLTEHEELVGLFAAGATDGAATDDAASDADATDDGAPPPSVTEPVTGPAARTGAGGGWEPDETGFLASARDLLGGYFAVEDPRRLEPAERECLVTTEVDDGRLVLRGYIDRLDVSPAGELRVVDYKTGGAPREAFEARALFQLKFYALVLWRTRGVVPRVLRLLYLKDQEICDYAPDTGELERFERTLVALWAAIERALAERDFRPKPSRLCGWCAHQALCPAFGGTPPPFPERVAAPVAEPTDLLVE
jgi:putative RecB family exonuclease